MIKAKSWFEALLRWRAAAAPFAAIAVLFVCLRLLYKETKTNQKRHDAILKDISKVENARFFSPILILARREFAPFAYAGEIVSADSHRKYWIVVETFDPTVSLNYFVYPKELYMSVETQQALVRRLLALDRAPAPHNPPREWDNVIALDPRVGVAILDQWDGTR